MMILLTLIYRRLLQYRVHIGLALLALTIGLSFTNYNGWWWFCLIFAIIALLSHVMFGPIRFIQEAIQNEDYDKANKYIKTVIFPRLLIKPVRQGFYMLQSNMAMANKDFKSAEALMNKSIKNKSKILGANSEGASYLQLGMLAMQNGKRNEAKKNLRLALEKGLPDKESEAAVYVQLSAIELQSRKISQAKNLLNKAKKLNPQSAEIKPQIKELERHINGAGNVRR